MAQMYTVGRLLRKARESSRLTLEEVAKRLHVRVDYLRALESDNLEVFKSPTYIKGLVKNYCNLVDIDYEKILPFLRRQIGEEDVKLTQGLEPLQVNSIQVSYVHLFIGVLVLLAGFLIFMVVRAYIKTVSPPLLEVTKPKQAALTVDTPQIEIEGYTEERVTVLVNGSQVPLDEQLRFKTSIKLSEGENRIVIEAYKNYAQDRRSIKELVITYQPQQREAGGEEQPQQAFAVSVRVEVIDQESWILIRSDDKQLAVGIKPKGYSYEFKPDRYFEIITGRPSVTKVYMDGEELEFKVDGNKISVYCEFTDGQWQCK